uniref:Uncharacterized protein n=1 Tax=Methylophaga nitratireducenticrescens TaxID=754476 RepID=I1XJP5_METNJ
MLLTAEMVLLLYVAEILSDLKTKSPAVLSLKEYSAFIFL